MSKFEPAVGDESVIGTLRIFNRVDGGCGYFDAFVTANGYDSVAQNIRGAGLRFEVKFVPRGLNDGDTVTATIFQGNFAAYAGNISKL